MTQVGCERDPHTPAWEVLIWEWRRGLGPGTTEGSDHVLSVLEIAEVWFEQDSKHNLSYWYRSYPMMLSRSSLAKF